MRRIFFQPASNFNLSPQGDGNCYGRFCNWLSGFQLIPTRGRKHWYDCIVVIFDRFQLIPARGRKLGAADLLPACIQFQLIPARGRKHLNRHDDVSIGVFQLIPARGRKQRSIVDKAHLEVDFNLSPQGDGNLDRRTLVVELDILTYPRKGTETSAISLDGEWMPISTYPRKGTET